MAIVMDYISILIPYANFNMVDKPFDYKPVFPPYSTVQQKEQEKEKPETTTVTPVVVTPIETKPEVKELTLEEKIATNANNCNTDTQWIRADNAECLDKPVYTTTSGYKYTVSAQSYSTSGNTYDYGYCTWYVKNRRPDLPNRLGNANQWFYNAQSLGLATGYTPAVGAVGQTTAGSLGHVVYVEAVYDNGTILVSEMNYQGWNVTSSRVANASEFNYIY